ncbi:hypothetical protein Tco_0017172 [Tanacetum coccineum]
MSTSSLQAEKTVYTSLTLFSDTKLNVEIREERSLNNNSFLGEYECSSLTLDREDMRDEKKKLDHLKQDQTMLVIKRFSERKKIFRERKKTGKIRAKRMVVKEIEDELLEEMEKFGWWFEQHIDGKNDDDNESKLVMVNEKGWMRRLENGKAWFE